MRPSRVADRGSHLHGNLRTQIRDEKQLAEGREGSKQSWRVCAQELGVSRACAEGPAGYCLAVPEPHTQVNRSFFFPKNSMGEGALIPQSWSLDPTLEFCPQTSTTQPCLLDLCLGWHAQKLSLGPCCSDSPCTQLDGVLRSRARSKTPGLVICPRVLQTGGTKSKRCEHRSGYPDLNRSEGSC